jgi:hypothetical protein
LDDDPTDVERKGNGAGKGSPKMQGKQFVMDD